jgi:tRNA modification GTPase
VNALARRDVAIVSPEAGTTRDAIEVHLDLAGYPVILIDTAGLREAGGAVEAEGIARARARAESADLVLALFAVDVPPDTETLALLDERAIVVASKVDLAKAHEPPHPNPLPAGARGYKGAAPKSPSPHGGEGGARDSGRVRGAQAALPISTKTNAGLDTLIKTLTARVSELLADRGTAPPTRARHREALTACLAALNAAGTTPLPELAAEELRHAGDALGRITGRIDIEDMLDAVFRDFCIGK